MKQLLQALFHALARLAASEAGECLSVRRKSHLLQNAMYDRLARGEAERPPARPANVIPLSAARCRRGGTRARRLVPAAL